MKRAICLGVISALTIGTAAQAQPAFMEPAFMIISWRNYYARNQLGHSAPAIREFSSMTECEVTARHLHSLRQIAPYSTEASGIWRSNRKEVMLGKNEPWLVTLCVPGVGEIKDVGDYLRGEGHYELLDD